VTTATCRSSSACDCGIIARIEEILEIVRDKLAASPFAAEPRGRVILTGGACQLTGLPDLAAQILGRPVRIGRPLGIAGLPEEAKGPAFAVATGLLNSAGGAS
jgi:cell division protein FtsA